VRLGGRVRSVPVEVPVTHDQAPTFIGPLSPEPVNRISQLCAVCPIATVSEVQLTRDADGQPRNGTAGGPEAADKAIEQGVSGIQGDSQSDLLRGE
jgi:hypothetical protein